jgi:hypothetical protein
MATPREQIQTQAQQSEITALYRSIVQAGAASDATLDKVEAMMEDYGIDSHTFEVTKPSFPEQQEIGNKILTVLHEVRDEWVRVDAENRRAEWLRQGRNGVPAGGSLKEEGPDARGRRHLVRTYADGFRERITFTDEADWIGYKQEQVRQEQELEARRRAVHAAHLPEQIRTKLDSAEELFKTLPGWEKRTRPLPDDAFGSSPVEGMRFMNEAQQLLRSIDKAVAPDVYKQLVDLISGELVVVSDDQAAQLAQGSR